MHTRSYEAWAKAKAIPTTKTKRKTTAKAIIMYKKMRKTKAKTIGLSAVVGGSSLL